MANDVLVIGGGVAGIQAALDTAERGLTVHLVERTPSIGGRMAQLDKTFPTMDCSICILAPKMAECYGHPNINVLTYSEVIECTGNAGDFKVKILKRARYIDEDKCTGCGECVEVCRLKGRIPNDFDMGLRKRGAIYIPFLQAVPRLMTIDRDGCIFLTKGKCGEKPACKEICKREAIDFEQKDKMLELNVGAIIVATGFDVWDPAVAPEYGYGKYQNVYTSLEYERIINAAGPTHGHILRRSDGKEPKKIAWIQCVGSRSTRYNPYCCSVCCMYATKEAMLVKEHGDFESAIFYKDMRAFGKGFNELVERAKNEYGVNYINSDATVERETDNTDLVVAYDVEGRRQTQEFGMVVLCPALIPTKGTEELAKILGVPTDQFKFFECTSKIMAPVDTKVEGIFVAGYCQEPKDIPESIAQGSAAAARAAQVIGGWSKKYGLAQD